MAGNGIKNRTLALAIFISFVCGFLAGAGYAIHKIGTRSPSPGNHPASVSDENGLAAQQAAAIVDLEAQTVTNPNNFQLWTQLGNLYYDTNQPEKAIKAYTRSLELHTGDANLLTDLGVMYRSAGQPKKALEYFDRAIILDLTHQPSRLNKGIVLLYDMHDPGKAIATWEELLRMDPEARTASGDSVRDFVEQVKKERGGSQ
jgi:tetratricopeptide (TPR) repeat protein